MLKYKFMNFFLIWKFSSKITHDINRKLIFSNKNEVSGLINGTRIMHIEI